MPRMNQAIILLFSIVAVITLIRLMLPYGIPDTKNILPEVYSPQNIDNAGQYLHDILARNLWDKERAALETTNSVTESGQSASEGNAGETNQEPPPGSLKLVGVSAAGSEPFAAIESDEGVQRYGPGELLPDGSRLEEVFVYGVRISNSGKYEQLYLFGKN